MKVKQIISELKNYHQTRIFWSTWTPEQTEERENAIKLNSKRLEKLCEKIKSCGVPAIHRQKVYDAFKEATGYGWETIHEILTTNWKNPFAEVPTNTKPTVEYTRHSVHSASDWH